MMQEISGVTPAIPSLQGGVEVNVSKVAESNPPMMTMARGRWTSAPMSVDRPLAVGLTWLALRSFVPLEVRILTHIINNLLQELASAMIAQRKCSEMDLCVLSREICMDWVLRALERRVKLSFDGPNPILIEDNGPGIPESELDKIFERFYRISGSPDEGCGLGLAIVKEIADLHRTCVRVKQVNCSGGTRIEVFLAAPIKDF